MIVPSSSSAEVSGRACYWFCRGWGFVLSVGFQITMQIKMTLNLQHSCLHTGNPSRMLRITRMDYHTHFSIVGIEPRASGLPGRQTLCKMSYILVFQLRKGVGKESCHAKPARGLLYYQPASPSTAPEIEGGGIILPIHRWRNRIIEAE